MKRLCTLNQVGKLLLCLLLIFSSFTLLAQTKTVTGTVLDNNGQPIAGVSIVIKGSSTGTTTNTEGKFSLTVPESAELQFSTVGYEMQSMKLNGRSIVAGL
jgi:hypothetical protein